MVFSAFLLEYEGMRLATIEDLLPVHEKHSLVYHPDGQKNLYVIETEIIDNRFFWLSCNYEDAVKFTDYVIDSETTEKQPNPRTQNQVEPRQQFFACYDSARQRLYLSSLNVRVMFRRFLAETAQKEFRLINIISSVDDLCSKIKTGSSALMTGRFLFTLTQEHRNHKVLALRSPFHEKAAPGAQPSLL